MISKLFFCALFFCFQRMLTCAFIFPLISILNTVQAQPDQGPALTAMGNTGATATGIWSINANPAGITTVARPCLSLGYSTVMNLPELATQNVLFAFPVQRNRFGIGVERYGFSAFNLLSAGLVYGKQFGQQLSIATRFNFHQVNAAEYGAVSAFSFDLGFRCIFIDNVALGAYITNPTRQEYPAEERGLPIPSGYSGGLSWQSSGQVLLAFSLEKERGQATDFRAGVSYTPSALFILRAGVSLKPLQHYGGFQVKCKSLVLDFAATSDQQLGYRPQIAMGYAW